MLKKQKHLGDEQKVTQLRLSGTSGFSVPEEPDSVPGSHHRVFC